MTRSATDMLEDESGRRFADLRPSVTEMCNFRCAYCLPDAYRPAGPHDVLIVEEIRRLVRGFAVMGTWKVRLTGGEPTVRHDFLEIDETLAAVPGIARVAMTTNGYKLARSAARSAMAGISNLNASVDSPRPALKSDAQIGALKERVLTALRLKTAGRRLDAGVSGETRYFAAIKG